MKLKLLYEKLKYEFPVFLLLLIQTLPQELDFSKDPYASFLAIDYGFAGFMPRLFPGSVMALFFNYRGHRQLNIFFGVILILSFLLISWIAGKLIRTADDDIKKMVIFFVALFLAGPYSSAAFFPRMFAPDRLLALFTLLGILLINKRLLRWLLPLIIVAALGTHEMFVFTYMPAIAILLLYELYETGYTNRSKVFVAINYLTIFVFTAYFYLFAKIKGITISELIAHVSSNTDVLPRKDMYIGYFFLEPHLTFTAMKSYIAPSRVFPTEYRAALFMLPLIIIFFVIWKNAFSASKNKFEKFIFILCIVAPLARIPLYPISSEVYRGRVPVIFVQFALLLYFLYRKNPAVIQSVKCLGKFLQRNKPILLLLVGYFAMSFSALHFSESWRELFYALIGPWQ